MNKETNKKVEEELKLREIEQKKKIEELKLKIKNAKPALLNDFLAKKIKKDESKNKTIDIYVTSMDKTLTLVNPSEEQILDYANAIADNADVRIKLEANRQLIYRCCKELQNPELHELLEIKDPSDTPRILFDMNDVQEIMNQFNSILSNKNIGEEIKN